MRATVALTLVGLFAPSGTTVAAQRSALDTMSKFEIYGAGQADLIFDFRRNNPAWFDVNRPSKLPAFATEFNANGNAYLSARQSRFGAKANRAGVFANVDFDMFGVGEDAGQTTIRLQHAYGQWGKVGGGQLESQFMDLDVFPNILDYWGPNGMIFFRNVQVFWRAHEDSVSQLTVALEQPGASGDGGIYAERIDIGNITFKTDVLHLQANYGAGIQNYFNDAPIDVGLENDFTNLRTPVAGKALPIFGAMVFLDHNWNTTMASAFGWSMVNITNCDAQRPDAYHNGQYATANFLWTPIQNVMMGGEFQFGRRENFSDDFHFDDYRLQFSFRYSFSQTFAGKP